MGFGFRVDRSCISPIKNLSLTLGVVVSGKGWGEMVQGAERGREATSPAMCPNEFIRTF